MDSRLRQRVEQVQVHVIHQDTKCTETHDDTDVIWTSCCVSSTADECNKHSTRVGIVH